MTDHVFLRIMHLKMFGFLFTFLRVRSRESWNETSCEQNFFSRRFEISKQYEFISPLM